MKNAQSLVEKLVFPIRIPTPFAVGDVYSYLITDDKIVLVDCGQLEERAFREIEEALDEQSLTFRDLDEIWLTHGHPDHFGQAAKITELSGATIKGHRKERSNFAGNKDRKLFADFFAGHGIPEQAIQRMVEQLDWLQQYQLAIAPNWIEEGDILSSGTLQFYVKHTPGHAAGHLAFVEDSGLIFGGDLLLEHITTNALINFDPDTENRNKSLLQYRRSLEWLKRQSGYLLPGHGKFIDDIPALVEHHLSEHEKRYAEVRKLLKGKSRSLLELAMRLFPEPMTKGDIFLVLSEVMGYLDWGIEEQKIDKVKSDGTIAYRLTDHWAAL